MLPSARRTVETGRAVENRRTHPRYLPDSLALSLCHDRISRVRNISRTGAFLEGPPPVPAGEEFECKLWLSSYETVVLVSIVRRLDGEDGFGVEFVNIKPDEGDQLLKYCGTLAPRK